MTDTRRYISEAVQPRWLVSNGPGSIVTPADARSASKVERWIRTVLSECLYLEVLASSAVRALALARSIGYYNDQRPHLGIDGQTPRRRLELRLVA